MAAIILLTSSKKKIPLKIPVPCWKHRIPSLQADAQTILSAFIVLSWWKPHPVCTKMNIAIEISLEIIPFKIAIVRSRIHRYASFEMTLPVLLYAAVQAYPYVFKFCRILKKKQLDWIDTKHRKNYGISTRERMVHCARLDSPKLQALLQV